MVIKIKCIFCEKYTNGIIFKILAQNQSTLHILNDFKSS